MAYGSLSSSLSNRIDKLKEEYLRYSWILHVLRERLHYDGERITMDEIRPEEEEEFETVREWMEETE